MRAAPARVDENQASIVSGLRAAGCTVQSLAAIGKGCPDIMVGIRLRVYLFEIKNPKQPPSKQALTPDEFEWQSKWRGNCAVITSVEQALAIINGQTLPPSPTVSVRG